MVLNGLHWLLVYVIFKNQKKKREYFTVSVGWLTLLALVFILNISPIQDFNENKQPTIQISDRKSVFFVDSLIKENKNEPLLLDLLDLDGPSDRLIQSDWHFRVFSKKKRTWIAQKSMTSSSHSENPNLTLLCVCVRGIIYFLLPFDLLGIELIENKNSN